MISRLTCLLLAATVPFLAGCSYLKYPNVHKLTILQGNIINQKMIDQLRPGLTRSQVRFIMGTPLIADTFSQSRWDYYYSIRFPGGQEMQERVSIYFLEDKLSYFTGDYLPTSVAAAMTANKATGETTEATKSAQPDSANTPAPTEAYPIEPAQIEVESGGSLEQ
jgi:outer membrane protein assembly factor BamE